MPRLISHDPLFTGSETERVLACPGSAALPKAKSTSTHAERGTGIHAFLRDVLALGRDEALERAPSEWREACESIDVSLIPHVDGRSFAAEVSYAYDLDTGCARELGRDLGRNYPALGEYEVPLTVDTVALTATGGVFVGDWKTGRGRVTPAERNPQLLLGALAVCRTTGRSHAEVMIGYIRPDERPWFDRAVLDDWTIDAFAARLREAGDAIVNAKHAVQVGNVPVLVTGDHCHYCPSFAFCPAQTSLVRSITAAPASFRDDVQTELTGERVAAAYYMWRRAKDVVNRAGEAIAAYAIERGGIDLGDGMVYGPVRSTREYVDGAVVRQVMTEMFGAEAADAACSWESTKAGIREALRMHVLSPERPKLAPLERKVLEKVDERGGLDRRTTTRVKEYSRKAVGDGND